MGTIIVAAVAIVVSYLIGTFPTALLVGRRSGFDPTAGGSGNPGATNAYRLGGRRAGAVVLVGDLVKGLGPTLAGLALAGRPLAAACGTAAVVGHVFPITRRFRGGKGVATGAGMVLGLWPLAFPVAVALFVVVAAATRKVSLASFIAALVLPVAVALIGYPVSEIVVLVLLAVVVIVRHRDNLSRLVRGEEGSLGSG
ncbi:MAG: glycerol-3-phosphate 1-O-acyltransferase PlsY [Acidimicrobiales bacterium]